MLVTFRRRSGRPKLELALPPEQDRSAFVPAKSPFLTSRSETSWTCLSLVPKPVVIGVTMNDDMVMVLAESAFTLDLRPILSPVRDSPKDGSRSLPIEMITTLVFSEGQCQKTSRLGQNGDKSTHRNCYYLRSMLFAAFLLYP